MKISNHPTVGSLSVPTPCLVTTAMFPWNSEASSGRDPSLGPHPCCTYQSIYLQSSSGPVCIRRDLYARRRVAWRLPAGVAPCPPLPCPTRQAGRPHKDGRPRNTATSCPPKSMSHKYQLLRTLLSVCLSVAHTTEKCRS